jgi:hypothetical protein
VKSWLGSIFRVSVIAGLAVAAGLIAVAPASAAVPGLQYVTVRTVTDSSVYKTVTVPCPAGLQVIGVGYELVGGLGSVVLDDFIPSTTSVTVGAGEVVGPGEPSDGTTQSWSIKATAVCANPPPGLQIVSQTSSFGPGGARQVFADCPVGKRVIGAGASLSNGFGQISIRGLSIADSFTVAEAIDDEDGYSGSWSITAYAVCANSLPGLQVTTGTSTTDSSSTKHVSAVCPFGKNVLGAGWVLNSGDQVLAANAFIGNGQVILFGTEDDNGFGGNWNVTANAICADV